MAYKLNLNSTARRARFSWRRRVLLIALTLCAVGSAAFSHAQGRYYRYVNQDGVRVMSRSIPPEYAQSGYEIISATGQVISKVEPAPEPVDQERAEEERALLARYAILARRYSSVDDILSARDRRLAHIDANIAILRSNIDNLQNQIDELMSKAAASERAGRGVHSSIVASIDEAKAELSTTQETLRLRQLEHSEIQDKFADDVDLFNEARALKKSGTSAANDGKR